MFYPCSQAVTLRAEGGPGQRRNLPSVDHRPPPSGATRRPHRRQTVGAAARSPGSESSGSARPGPAPPYQPRPTHAPVLTPKWAPSGHRRLDRRDHRRRTRRLHLPGDAATRGDRVRDGTPDRPERNLRLRRGRQAPSRRRPPLGPPRNRRRRVHLDPVRMIFATTREIPSRTGSSQAQDDGLRTRPPLSS
jgi:hypothetical protein